MAKLKEAPEKPGNDVYTGLLALSLAAMIIGCVLLFLDLQTYEGRTPAPTPKLDLPTQFKTTPAAATPRTEKKDEPAAPPMPPPEEKKEGTRREPKAVPAVPTSNPKAETPAPKPVGMAEPAPLPLMVGERVDRKVVPAVALEPVKPEARKTGDEPPVTTPAFRPN